MNNYKNSAHDLLSYLRMQGPTLSTEVVAYFGFSRPTLSRRVQELGDAIVTIGKGRATRLAARHADLGDSIQLYQVQESGQVVVVGHLTAVQQSESILWFLETEAPQAALRADEFKDGLFPGWPWFLDDLRPSGFLGQAFGQRMSTLFSIDKDPNKWSDFELLRTLVGFGSNLQGNFILGNGRALSEFQDHKLRISDGYYRHSTPGTYSEKAMHALNEGEEFGSSAGGEQPKFTTMICETPEDTPRAVIVKFSPKLEMEVGQRWADLLHAEHIANQVLANAGFATAQTRIFHFENRIFLESERFDRVGASGRKGLVTLRALDAAYISQACNTWSEVAGKLHSGKWITREDRDRMVRLHCFGQLIANNDMHWGNLSFFLSEELPYRLAPVYDMLPMYFRPSGTGEIVERRFSPKLPRPEDQSAWLEMYPHALCFWETVQASAEISSEFQKIAHQAIEALNRIHNIATGIV